MRPTRPGDEGEGTPGPSRAPTSHRGQGHTVYEYELQQYRSADLIRHAERQRRVRAVLRARRALTQDPTGPEDRTHRSPRHRYTRAA